MDRKYYLLENNFKINCFIFCFFFVSLVCFPQINYKSNLVTSLGDTVFVNLRTFSDDFVYDIKYATKDNFLHEKIYNCGECYLRYSTVKALLAANRDFLKKGLRIKIFDCYRPLSVQKKMWQIVSNPSYVANPAKGSIHNRGGAVDISLVTIDGKELQMGTPFDFFGKEASHSYKKFSKEVIKNRKILKSIMQKNNFTALQSEWWHYNLNFSESFTLSNEEWLCD